MNCMYVFVLNIIKKRQICENEVILNLFNLISYFFFRSIEVQGDGKEGNKDLKLLKTLQKPNGALFEQILLITSVWDNENLFVWV